MSEYITMRDCLKQDLKDAIAQRDEAREALREVERENDQLLASNKNYERDWPVLVHERNEARADADEWQNKYAEVFVERDRLREDLALAIHTISHQLDNIPKEMRRIAADRIAQFRDTLARAILEGK